MKFLAEDNFNDVWRVYHEQEKRFYLEQKKKKQKKKNVSKQARLDFFLVSGALFPYITDASKITGLKSDHHGILLNLKINDNERKGLFEVQQYIIER